mmetsp:Transcript_10597/g.15741  ORF Transcript_10597/g.15741 Transcript_10597/m.15741 type:complete len:117 (-) Transcript_10597:742-1092(-)
MLGYQHEQDCFKICKTGRKEIFLFFIVNYYLLNCIKCVINGRCVLNFDNAPNLNLIFFRSPDCCATLHWDNKAQQHQIGFVNFVSHRDSLPVSFTENFSPRSYFASASPLDECFFK